MKEATAELINNRQNKTLKVQYDIVSLHPLYDCVLCDSQTCSGVGTFSIRGLWRSFHSEILG